MMLLRTTAALLSGVALIGCASAQVAVDTDAAGPYGLDKDAYILRYKSIHAPVIARGGMVSTQNDIATQIGIDILEQGGNAVDASVAVGFALTVTLPRAGNIGGGGFMLVHDTDKGETYGIDYRETAPTGVTANDFLDDLGEKDLESRFDWPAVGVPGSVAGLHKAWEMKGTLPWADLIEPSIRLAEDGFPVSYDLAEVLTIKRDWLSLNQASLVEFYRADGSPYGPGEMMRRPALAGTLKLIAEQGPQVFYEGEIADRIVADMAANGGHIDHQDLADYEVLVREPLSGTYRGYEIVAMPPPSSGGVAIIQMLNILEGFPISEWGYSSKSLHVFAEAMKLVFADRGKHLADPAYFNSPVESLIDKAYGKSLADEISLTETLSVDQGRLEAYLAAQGEESPSTTHYSIIDAEGNAVSNTYTLSSSFGSGLTIEGTGILLNNQIHTFSVRAGIEGATGFIASDANKVEAGKRPISSQSPTMVFKDGEPFLILGSPGGSRIINAVAQLIVNVIDHDMNIADATHQPRIHHQWVPDKLEVEPGFNPDTQEALRALGHNIEVTFTMGSTQSIHIDRGYVFGASDPRRPNALTLGVEATQ
ncbi:MAG: gamma-glutamyltransferase [Pseudomonadota bacterium]